MDSLPLLLLSLAAGYGVLVLSNKQERPLDKLGRVIGGLVLLGALAGLLWPLVCAAKYMCGGNTSCPISSKKIVCPEPTTSSSSAEPAAAN